MSTDIHNFAGKLESFYEKCKAEGLKDSHILKMLYWLARVSNILGKPFDEATKEDIVKVVGKVEDTNFRMKQRSIFLWQYCLVFKSLWGGCNPFRKPTSMGLSSSNRTSEG
ncbi:MAG: hypothetical protein QW156_00630 [Candidatus Aenigmatarchaeota archaeon]